jgi:hypothetical protein
MNLDANRRRLTLIEMEDSLLNSPAEGRSASGGHP